MEIENEILQINQRQQDAKNGLRELLTKTDMQKMYDDFILKISEAKSKNHEKQIKPIHDSETRRNDFETLERRKVLYEDRSLLLAQVEAVENILQRRIGGLLTPEDVKLINKLKIDAPEIEYSKLRKSLSDKLKNYEAGTKNRQDVILRLEKGFSEDFVYKKEFIIVPENADKYKGSGKEVLILENGKVVKEKGGPVVARPVNSETEISIRLEKLSGKTDVERVVNIIQDHFFGDQIKTIKVIYDIESRETVKALMDIAGKISNGDTQRKIKPKMVEWVVSTDGKQITTRYDNIANQVPGKGTPYYLTDGGITHDDKVLITSATDKNGKPKTQFLEHPTDGKIKEAQKQGKTGLVYSEAKDPIGDAQYTKQKTTQPIEPNRKNNLLDLNVHKKNKQAVNEGNLNKFKKKKYEKEIIIALNSDDNVEKAYKYLLEKYKDKKPRLLTSKEGEFVDKTQRHGMSGNDLAFDETTRITIVGHGSTDKNGLKIGGLTAKQAAAKIIEGFNLQEGVKIGKISLVCCNAGTGTVSAEEIAKSFGVAIVQELFDNGIESKASVRSAYMQVNSKGQKIYGIPTVSGEIDWVSVDGQDKFKKVEVWVKDGKATVEFKVKKAQPKSELELSGLLDDETRLRPELTGLPDEGVDRSKPVNGFDFGDMEDTLIAKSPDDIQYFDDGGTDEETSKLLFSDVDADLEQPIERRHSKEATVDLTDENGIKASLMETRAKMCANKLEVAIAGITKEYGPQWTPDIDSAKRTGDVTEITLYNTDDMATKTVQMSDNTISDIKNEIKLAGEKIQNPLVSKKSRRVSIGISTSMSVFGGIMFIRSVVQQAKLKKCNKVKNECPTDPTLMKLNKALEVHAIMGLTEGSVGVAVDIVQFSEMATSSTRIKTAMSGIKSFGKHAHRFSKVTNALGKVSMGVGAVGSVASLGFSIYELAHAKTKQQKIEFGIQVGFDCLNVITTGVTIGATIATAVSTSIATGTGAAASFCSAAGGPIGVAVGAVIAVTGFLVSTITSLVFEFKGTTKQAKAVGEYFYDLNEGYKSGGLDFPESHILSYKKHVVVDEIDMNSGYVTFGSQYIYRTKHGSTGSGKKNYFFHVGHAPEMVYDRSQALNIRAELGHSYRSDIRRKYQISAIVLPFTPKCYFKYKWKRLPFCTTMNHKGFSVLRKLEDNYEFDYDFYVVPGEKTINELTPEYVSTYVTVRLSEEVRQIIVPNLHYTQQKYFTYKLYSNGGRHYIQLSDGVKLSIAETRTNKTEWHLFCERMSSDDFDISGSTLSIGNTTLVFTSKAYKLLFMHDKSGTITQIDMKRRRWWPISANFETADLSVNELRQHIRSLTRNNPDAKPFITIDNFEQHGKFIGRAYYDVRHDGFIYSDMKNAAVSDEFKNSVDMLHVTDSLVYFSGKHGNAQLLWSTDRQTRAIQSSYQFFCGNERYNISVGDLQGNVLYMKQQIQSVTLYYGILPNEITLVSIAGRRDDVRNVASGCIPSLLDFLPQTNNFQFPGRCLYPKSLPLLPLVEKVGDEYHHYWLYTEDTNREAKDRNDVFCSPSNAPLVTGIINPNMTNQCHDLSLLDIRHIGDTREIRYYYCYIDGQMYVQVNDEESKAAFPNRIIDVVQNFGPYLYIHMKTGLVYKPYHEEPYITFAGVNHKFFLQYPNWTHKIEEVIDEGNFTNSMLLILGLVDKQNKSLQAWIDTARNSIIIDTFNKTDIEYKGPAGHPQYVWLFSPVDKKLIVQKVANITTDFTVSPTQRLIMQHEPYARVIDDTIENAENFEGHVLAATEQGVALSIDRFGYKRLLTVSGKWLKDNEQNIEEAANELCDFYNSSQMIALGTTEHDNNTELSLWYHCQYDTFINFSIPVDESPRFLGINLNSQTAHFATDGKILTINVSISGDDVSELERQKRSVDYDPLANDAIGNESAIQFDNVGYASIIGSTMTITVPEDGQLSFIPTMKDVPSLVIATGESNSEIDVREEVWFHYENIVYTTEGTEGNRQDVIRINAPRPCLYPITVVGSSTVIVDLLNKNQFVLLNFLPYSPIYGIPTEPDFPVLTVYVCDDVPVILVSSTVRLRPVEHETSLIWFLMGTIAYYVVGMSVLLFIYLVLAYCKICRLKIEIKEPVPCCLKCCITSTKRTSNIEMEMQESENRDNLSNASQS